MENLEASIVLVTSSDPDINKFGTGFVVAHAKDVTFIVTCAHVVRDTGGPEKLKVNGHTARVIASGQDGWPDIAVLQIAGTVNVPALELWTSGRRGSAFASAGFQLYGNQYLLRQIRGTLGEPAGLEARDQARRVQVWELRIEDEARLQPGYSGAPVVDQASGGVIAVVSHREGEGKKGLAISIEALQDIWQEFPQHLATKKPDRPRPRSDGITLDILRERTLLFVGRTEDLRLLDNKLKAALNGHGTSGFIVGEAGTGKSTLVLKLASQVMETNQKSIFALARIDMVSGAHMSYAPFKSIMEQILVCDNTVVDTDGRVVRPIDIVADTLRAIGVKNLGPFTSFAGTATETLQKKLSAGTSYEGGERNLAMSIDQSMLFDCYSKVICNVSCYFPLLIVLDDIHWADESSLLLLLHLGRVIEFHPILIVSTFRPEDAAQNKLLWEIRDRLGSLGAFTADLQKKDRADAYHHNYQFCHDYLMAKYYTIFSEWFLQLLVTLTNGNALFLVETLINLEEKGYIRSVDGICVLNQPVDDIHHLPARIEHVISQRVNRLDDSLLTILKYGSVQGETFTAEVISHIQGIDKRTLLQTIIDKLIRLHQLVLGGATRRLSTGIPLHTFSFHHILTQRYIYEYLLTAIEREMFHEEVATCLESLWADTVVEIAPQLATHYALAGVSEKTVKFALLAGESFLKQYGWSEVTKFARLGLQVWEQNSHLTQLFPPDTPIRLRLLYAKGELEGGVYGENTDHIQAGIDTLRVCLPLLDQLDVALVADVYLTLGKLVAAKQLVTEYYGNEYLDEALRIYDRLGDKDGIITALSIYSFDTNLASQTGADMQLAHRRRCVELARELGNPILLAKSLSDLAMHYFNFDTDEEEALAVAEELAQRSLDIAAKQNLLAEMNSLLILSWVYHHRGYYGEKLEQHRINLLELARRHGQTVFVADALTDLGHYYSFVINTQDKAAQIMQEAYDFRIQMGRHAVHDCENFAGFLFRRGQFDKSIQLFEHALQEEDEQRATRTRSQIARILALTGQEERARALLRDIDALMNANPALATLPNSPLMLTYALLGDRTRALLLSEHVQKAVISSARRGLFHTYADYATEIAEVYRLLGAADMATPWIETAAHHWQALSKLTDIEQLIMFWEHQFVRGKLLVEQGQHQNAQPILEQSCAVFTKAGHHAEAEALMFLGQIYQQQLAPEAAATCLRQAMDKAQALNIPHIVREAQQVMEQLQ